MFWHVELPGLSVLIWLIWLMKLHYWLPEMEKRIFPWKNLKPLLIGLLPDRRERAELSMIKRKKLLLIMNQVMLLWQNYCLIVTRFIRYPSYQEVVQLWVIPYNYRLRTD